MLKPALSQVPSANDSYAVKTVQNVAWLGGTQFIRQFMAIGTTVVLARFLTPSDYGIFAMTLFVNELAQMFIDFGIGSALVQRKQVDARLLSTCFWINLAIGTAVALLVIVAGPVTADYFNQPLVAQLLLVSALNLMVAALVVIPQAVLTRRLAFNHVALGTTVGSLVGAVCTIAMAAAGAGIWALVFQPLIGTTVNLLYVLWKSGWRPTAEFSLSCVHGILGFSGQVLVSNVANHLTRNLQQVIVAPLIGPSAIGLLTMAITVAWMPVAQFTSAAVRAIYPVFARLQDEQDRLDAGLRKTIGVVSLLAFPVLMGLAVLAADLLPVVFGSQWVDAAPLVSVLCGLCLVQSITFLVGSTLLAKGRADLTMKIALVSVPIVAAALWLVRHEDIFWVTVSLSASHLTVSLLTLHLALRGTRSGWMLLLTSVWRPLIGAVAMAVLLHVLRASLPDLAAGVRLLLLIAVGALFYLALTWVVNRFSLMELIGLFSRRRG